MKESFFNKLRSVPYRIEVLYKNLLYPPYTNDAKDPKVNVGKVLAAMNSQKQTITSLSEVEFQVFSQFGDDGIIQYLISKIDIPNKTFVEFGVENYKEANTRFLTLNNYWSGMVIDGSASNIKAIKADIISWSSELYAKEAFIDASNINNLIQEFLDLGYDRDLGILSIDIDGNDYWVWKAIDVISPVIVIAEYNSLFGYEKPYTVPYNPRFVRNTKYNISYWGTSLGALYHLAQEKDYVFVGCNQAGNNAYFIRRDKMTPALREVSCKEGFVSSKFRELIDDKTGERPFGKQRVEYLKGLPLHNVDTDQVELFE